MIKVLFVIDSLTCGGAEKSLVSLLPLLDPKKYELYLWMRKKGGDFEPLLPKKVNVVEQPKYSIIEKLFLIIGQIFFSISLRLNHIFGFKEHGAETLWRSQGWALKVPKGEWDVVIAYQQGLPTYLVANKFKGVKKVGWINVDLVRANYNIEYNQQFYEKLDAIVAVSDKLNDMVSKIMPKMVDKTKTVYDIINPEIIRQWSKQEVKELKQTADETVIVTTGRLTPQKGYDLATQAAKQLKDRGMKFRWYFIGEGSEREHILELIRKLSVDNEVELLGLQTNPYAYMRQADVYVQTSKFEGFCMTIKEAKILGKPVVSTDFEVIYNQLVDGKNGLITQKNGESIANAIYKVVTDNALRQTLIENVMSENYYTFSSEVKKVEGILDQLCQ